MINSVRCFLKKYKIQNKTVLAALSGGADSSVMFFILNSLKEEFNLKIAAIHLNHNWRGEESRGDMEFCRQLADGCGCEFFSSSLNSSVKKTENDAREARYTFFDTALEKFKTDVCFLAHNKNDNVETLIYRLVKGTGVAGLASIPEVREPYYRPLINFSRAEIENFAKQNGIKYRCDSSNEDDRYKRNFIRLKVLPLMESVNKNVLNSLSSLINLAVEHNEIIEDYISLLEDNVFNKNEMNWFYKRPAIVRSAFLNLKEPVQREILSRYFKGLLKNRDFKNILKIQNFIKENENSTLSINKDTFLKVKDGSAFLYRRDDRVRAFDECEKDIFEE